MKHTIEEKNRAASLVRDRKMSFREAARLTGVPCATIHGWLRLVEGDPDDLYNALAGQSKPRRGRGMGLTDEQLGSLPDDPGELKRIIFDLQFEADLREAVCELLKKDPGVDPRTLPNREKAIVVDALARRGTYSTGWMASCVGLAPATFYYHRKRIGRDREGLLRPRVVKACRENPAWGYRRVKWAMENDGEDPIVVSEKRVRRIMREEGLQPPRRRPASRYSSYDARKDKGEALPNVPLREDGTHDFFADAPNVLWVSDVTEFALPGNRRVYLSSVLDCYDSSLRGWKIAASPKSRDLTDPSLEEAARSLRPGDSCVLHTDKGGHYFAESWIAKCARHGIARSMSRKGHSPDNARMEGFFGRLKMEFFDTRDWRGVGVGEFESALDSWLRYYNEERPKQSLGWISPVQYRNRYYAAA